MAQFSALSLVAQAVASLLFEANPQEEFPNAEFPVVGASTLNEVANASPSAPPGFGVSVYPYRVSYNVQRRPSLPRVSAGGKRFRASLLLDLHLLLTAWANSGAQQMRLLAWAARTLEDTPMLPPGLLNRWAAGGEEVFHATESVELVGEPLSLQDLVSIWEINKPRQQPSLGFVARMIAIDSDVRVPEPGLVGSRQFDHGVLTS